MTLNKGERNEKKQDFWFCYLPKDSNSRPPSHESYFSAQDFVFSLVFWAFMLTLHHLISSFLLFFGSKTNLVVGKQNLIGSPSFWNGVSLFSDSLSFSFFFLLFSYVLGLYLCTKLGFCNVGMGLWKWGQSAKVVAQSRVSDAEILWASLRCFGSNFVGYVLLFC